MSGVVRVAGNFVVGQFQQQRIVQRITAIQQGDTHVRCGGEPPLGAARARCVQERIELRQIDLGQITSSMADNLVDLILNELM